MPCCRVIGGSRLDTSCRKKPERGCLVPAESSWTNPDQISQQRPAPEAGCFLGRTPLWPVLVPKLPGKPSLVPHPLSPWERRWLCSRSQITAVLHTRNLGLVLTPVSSAHGQVEGLIYAFSNRVFAWKLLQEANCFSFKEKAFLSHIPMRNTHFSQSQGFFCLTDEEKWMQTDSKHRKES